MKQFPYKLTLLVAVVILFLSVTTGSSLPKVSIPHADKYVHLFMYAAFVVSLLLDKSRFCKEPFTWRLWWVPVIVSIIYGGMMELLQAGISWRTSSWSDFGANVVGTFCGLFIYWIIDAIFRPKEHE